MLIHLTPNFWNKVDKSGECWLWTGAKTREGYGIVHDLAHRVVYRAAGFEIPAGLQLDHLCNVRNCVNPDHLEPVTGSENVRRSWLRAQPGSRRRPTHCRQGHEFTVENTYVRSNGERDCRACERARYLRRKQIQ